MKAKQCAVCPLQVWSLF